MPDPDPDPEPNAVLIETSPSGITTITLNRPHVRNAVNTPTSQKLYNAFLAFESDPAQKIAILTGSNGTFCAGFDLHEVAAGASASHSDPRRQQRPVPQVEPVLGQNRGPMGPSRMHLSKPLVAAVAGHAVAGGLELALLADLRVVEEDAVFGVFCRRWGVPLIDGGTVRLQAVVGLGRALDMVMTGRAVGAREAEGMGLASRVVGRGEALGEARRLAEEIARWPERCMRVDREGVYWAAYQGEGMEEALRREFERGSEVVQTESVRGAERFSRGAGRHGDFKGSKL